MEGGEELETALENEQLLQSALLWPHLHSPAARGAKSSPPQSSDLVLEATAFWIFSSLAMAVTTTAVTSSLSSVSTLRYLGYLDS